MTKKELRKKTRELIREQLATAEDCAACTLKRGTTSVLDARGQAIRQTQETNQKNLLSIITSWTFKIYSIGISIPRLTK